MIRRTDPMIPEKKSEMGELLFERVEYRSQLIDSYITKHVI
jgi:hypothetical protein